MKRSLLFTIIASFSLVLGHAQKIIQGHVYGGQNQSTPVDSMQIRTASGNITYSDHNGKYMVAARDFNDTLFIAYRGRAIIHYPISFIKNPNKFDVYLQNQAFFDTTYFDALPELVIKSRNYHTDSIYKRQMYADVYDYTKPKFNPFSPVTSVYNLFSKKYIKRQERYRDFAINNEQSGYINNRFTRSYVARLTHIQNDTILTDFMKRYRPAYKDIVEMNELELGQYIIDSYKKYKADMKKE